MQLPRIALKLLYKTARSVQLVTKDRLEAVALNRALVRWCLPEFRVSVAPAMPTPAVVRVLSQGGGSLLAHAHARTRARFYMHGVFTRLIVLRQVYFVSCYSSLECRNHCCPSLSFGLLGRVAGLIPSHQRNVGRSGE